MATCVYNILKCERFYEQTFTKAAANLSFFQIILQV